LGILLKNLEFWLYILPSSIKRYVESIAVLDISVAKRRLFSAIFVETSFGMFCAFTLSILRKRPNVNVNFFIDSFLFFLLQYKPKYLLLHFYIMYVGCSLSLGALPRFSVVAT
jgi:hypothetical protein